jgi:hypothetical protein
VIRKVRGFSEEHFQLVLTFTGKTKDCYFELGRGQGTVLYVGLSKKLAYTLTLASLSHGTTK